MSDAAIARWPSLDGLVIATDAWTRPFWDAAAEHRLVVQRCTDCQRLRMPPTPFCPACRSQACEWPELSGRGVIYSFTIVATAVTPRHADHVPYVPALIEPLDAPGVRLVSNVVDAPLAAIRIGAEVEVVWQDGPAGLSVPRFRLAVGP
jgi:uncharacterized OB-fold protein